MTTAMADQDLLALADRVEASRGFDNSLDVACEIALFKPDGAEAAIRANNAGTKVIVTYRAGDEKSYIARDFTISERRRRSTAAALRALATIKKEESRD